MTSDNIPTLKGQITESGFTLKPYRKSSILFLCNQKRCKKCSEECKHTSDISYAKNKEKVMYFENEMGIYVEVEE